VRHTLSVISVQCLCGMLSVYRKATELTVLSDSSAGLSISVRNSGRLMTQAAKNDWNITLNLRCMYTEPLNLSLAVRNVVFNVQNLFSFT
jgi:hypothetical protein